MTPALVQQLLRYPVKSMAGADCAELEIERRGGVNDRRWMLVDDTWRFVTGRMLPSLVRCEASVMPGGLLLSLDGESLSVPTPTASAVARDVEIWRDRCPARDAGNAAADWLSQKFGRPLRLVYQADDQHRPLRSGKANRAGDEVSFADGYPLLLIGSASLAELNGRLAEPVGMANFRPNIVARTSEPFIEDGWQQIEISGVQFAVASRCSRCVFTTVDPRTGERRGDGEPLKSLRSYRRDADSGQIMFGVNLIPVDTGTVRVGDEVCPAR